MTNNIDLTIDLMHCILIMSFDYRNSNSEADSQAVIVELFFFFWLTQCIDLTAQN